MAESASTITYQKTLQPLFCVCPELWLEAEATQGEQPTVLQIKEDEELLVSSY